MSAAAALEVDVVVVGGGPAGEVAAGHCAATVAVAARLPLAELRHAVPAFPTVAEVWLHALDAAGI